METKIIYLTVCIVFLMTYATIFDIKFVELAFKIKRAIDDTINYVLNKEPTWKPQKHMIFSKKSALSFNVLKEKKNRTKVIKLIYILLLSFGALLFLNKSIFIIPIIYYLYIFPDLVYKFYRYKQYTELVDDLHITLGLISGTYINMSSLSQAIDTNYKSISPRLKEIFDYYLLLDKNSVDIQRNLEKMKAKIDHPLWIEWISVAQDCIYDSNQKDTLQRVVYRFNVDREIRMNNERKSNESKTNFNLSVIISSFGIVSILFLKKDVFNIFFNTWYGNSALSLVVCMVAYAIHGAYSALYSTSVIYTEKEVK